MMMVGDERLRIGQVARAAAVNVQTLRYYERQGLLPAPRRTPAGYRVYAAGTVDTLRAIKRAQALGFTLRDIRELMTIRSRRRSASAVGDMVAGKIGEIDDKIRDLRRMRRALRDVVERCECGGDLSRCDVLAGLGTEATL
jgi:MerR family copper efflux transcriptional regulator